MSIQREILQRLAQRFLGHDRPGFSDNADFGNERQGRTSGMIATLKREVVFIVLAIVIVVFFVIAGLYELVVATPLNEWFSQLWQTVIHTSPQTITELPQQVFTNGLMQRTIGDWLNYIPSLLKQAAPIVIAPFDALIAVVIVGIALAIRLGRYAFGQNRVAKGLSWALLASSFAPLFLDYYIW